MEHDPREAVTCSPRQEIPHNLRKPKFHYSDHNSLPLVPMLSPANQSQICPQILQWAFSFMSFPPKFIPTSPPSHACDIPHPAPPPPLRHSNYRLCRLSENSGILKLQPQGNKFLISSKTVTSRA